MNIPHIFSIPDLLHLGAPVLLRELYTACILALPYNEQLVTDIWTQQAIAKARGNAPFEVTPPDFKASSREDLAFRLGEPQPYGPQFLPMSVSRIAERYEGFEQQVCRLDFADEWMAACHAYRLNPSLNPYIIYSLAYCELDTQDPKTRGMAKALGAIYIDMAAISRGAESVVDEIIEIFNELRQGNRPVKRQIPTV